MPFHVISSATDAFWRHPGIVVYLRRVRIADGEGVDTREQIVPQLVVVVDQDDWWLGHSRRAAAPSDNRCRRGTRRWASVSTRVLYVPVASRWSNDSKRQLQKDENQLTAFKMFFDELGDTFCGESEFKRMFFQEPAVEVRFGLPMRGSCGVCVTVRNAHADLSALTDSENPTSLSAMSSDPARAHLSFLCLLVEHICNTSAS